MGGGATLDVVNVRSLGRDYVSENSPMFSVLIRKYAGSRISTRTPSGTYTNDPPDHTIGFHAASLLSLGGMTVAKYSRTMSPCLRDAVSHC